MAVEEERGGWRQREDHGVKDFFQELASAHLRTAAVPPTAACHLGEKGPGTSEDEGGGGGCQRDAQRSSPRLTDTKPRHRLLGRTEEGKK